MGKKGNSITRGEFVRMALYSVTGVVSALIIARGNLKTNP